MADTPNLRQHFHELRRRSAAASGMDEIDSLLDAARALLKQAFQTDLEEEARTVFRELRDRRESLRVGAMATGSGGAAAPGDQLAMRVQRERLRLGGGTPDDAEQALKAMFGLLDELKPQGPHDALRRQVLAALESAAAVSTHLRHRILEFVASPAAAGVADLVMLRDRIEHLPPSAAGAAPTAHAADESAPVSADEALAQRLARARRLFYGGDYFEAADALAEILQLDPDNEEARGRLAQVEDNIKRGIVPDSRVPFQARVAFGRAQSLERAGRLAEARDSYRLALDEARAGGPLLANWQPAVEALMRIDNSMIARETREEGDALLQGDQWPEAAEKYEIVLKLLPDDAHSSERLRLLNELREGTEALRAQVEARGGSLAEAAVITIGVQQTIASLRANVPGSARLSDLELDVAEKAKALKDQLLQRSSQLIDQARFLPNLAECSRRMQEASQLLRRAAVLAPGDENVLGEARAVESELGRLRQAEADLDEARQLLNLNTESARGQARDMLRGVHEFGQDPAYLQLVSHLRRQYLDEADAALRQKQLRAASRLLALVKAEPFQGLGDSEEVAKLEQEFAAARREPWLRAAGWASAFVIAALVVGGLARPLGGMLFAATPTPAGSSAAVLADAPTAEIVPTATTAPTATPLPTAAATETPFPQPTETPTAQPRFGAVRENTAARLSPNGLSPWAFTLRAADPVQVLDEVRDSEGRLWYKVYYIRGDSSLIGWAQARDINVQPTRTP